MTIRGSGAFTPAARAAILTATLDRCAGCGSTWNLSIHHRRPRGMGGTSNVLIEQPWNGLALCGDGVRGCHGWAESHRDTARLLGWLTPTPTPDAPCWTRVWGWVVWVLLDDEPATWCVRPVEPPSPDAERAVTTYRRERTRHAPTTDPR